MPRPRNRRELLREDPGQAGPIFAASSLSSIEPALPKTAQVYDVIRRAIVGLAMPPGSVINEKTVCEQLGISRTPLREAILKLTDEHLVMIVPNSGTYVSKIDLQTVFDGQLIRDALEMKVVRLAAVKMSPAFDRKLEFNMYQQGRLAAALDYDGFYELDEAFHSMICEFGASARVWKIVHGAKGQLDRIRRLAFPVPKHLEIVLTEHSAIATALRIRDPDAAGATMKVHLDRVFETIRTLLVQKREYFATTTLENLENYVNELSGDNDKTMKNNTGS
jgi:DNA-binding GntR family transcriptional regulator